MSATQTQVGGSHYKDMKIQPVDYIHANGISYMAGSVIKYVSRYKSKNGKQDLEKAIHFLELLIDREYPETDYRMLEEGEVFQFGDEFQHEGKWEPADESCWRNGYKFRSAAYVPHRRPIKKDSK